MSPPDEIDGIDQYRRIRPIREGSVFAKYKVKKKSSKKESSEEENLPKEKKASEHRIDIEA